MKKLVVLVLACLLISLPVLQNCGVAFGGSRYNAQIIAKDHPNAEIYVNDELVGTGEFSGLYYRNRPLRVELREEGCEPRKKTNSPNSLYSYQASGHLYSHLFS